MFYIGIYIIHLFSTRTCFTLVFSLYIYLVREQFYIGVDIIHLFSMRTCVTLVFSLYIYLVREHVLHWCLHYTFI